MSEGYGSFEDYVDGVREVYGDEEADRVKARMNELATRDATTIGGGSGLDRGYQQRVIAENPPRYALIAGPDAEFLKGIEYALATFGAKYFDSGGPLAGHEASTQYLAQLDELFAKRGVPYRVQDHQIVSAGDQEHRDLVVEPALRALADVRLGRARDEFEAALAHLRAGTQKELEDPIEEAGKSVESAMKVLVTDTGTPPPKKATAWPLF